MVNPENAKIKIERSLTKRLQRLEELKHRIKKPKESPKIEVEDYSEFIEKEDEIIEKAIDPVYVEEEILHIKKLLKKIRDLKGYDTKLEKLKEVVEDIKFKSEKLKLIIFSEYKDTGEYLKKELKGFKIVTIHGDQPPVERLQNLELFKKHGEVLIATDAAGEGIDLQFCQFMINYDLSLIHI